MQFSGLVAKTAKWRICVCAFFKVDVHPMDVLCQSEVILKNSQQLIQKNSRVWMETNNEEIKQGWIFISWSTGCRGTMINLLKIKMNCQCAVTFCSKCQLFVIKENGFLNLDRCIFCGSFLVGLGWRSSLVLVGRGW